MINDKEISIIYYLHYHNYYSYNDKLCIYLDLLFNDSKFSNIEHLFIELLYLEGILSNLNNLQIKIMEYKMQNLSYDEIASILSLTNKQVKTEYEKSIKKMKKKLKIIAIN